MTPIKVDPTLYCVRCENQPDHAGECRTARGRLLRRPCRSCGARLRTYSSRSRRVHCDACVQRQKARCPVGQPRPVKARPLHLSEWRAKLECEAFPDAALRRIVYYNLVKHVVGQCLGLCERRECGWSCDARTATLVTMKSDQMTIEERAEYQVSGREPATIERILCARCAPALRASAAPNYVVSWLWGAELCDGATKMAAGMPG